MNLEGTFVALVTPFKNGKINEEKIRDLVRLQIENGTDGIVPCGTTGESPALTEEEKKSYYRYRHRRSKRQGSCNRGHRHQQH